MEVRAGYKQTEVGVIPDEWDVSRLDELCLKITDGTHDTPTPVRTGRPFLTAIHIKENLIDYDNCLYLTEDDHRTIFARCNPQNGDVLMVNIGAGVATTALVDVDFEFSLKNVALLKPASSRATGRFLNHSLAKRKPAITQALLSGGAQPFLSLTQIGRIRIPVPPKSEQEAIAATLSDVDALLGGLDRLIAKKRDLKQAAMQQLLSGQIRLPGFSGDWETKRLGALGSTYGGLTGKTKADFGDGEGQYVTFLNVMTNLVIDSKIFERVRVAANESQNQVMPGDLLFNGSSETPDEVAMCSFVSEYVARLFLNSFCFGFRIKDNAQADGLFLAHYIRSDEGRELMKSLAQGSTRYNLSKAALLGASIRLPSKAEQAAIAAVLSDMDAELTAFEARRDKTRALKQAMMQELLTGRTRLV